MVHVDCYGKMPEEINDLKTELLSKKEAELKDQEKTQPIYTVKNEKVCVEGVAKVPLIGLYVSAISTEARSCSPRQWKDDPKSNSEIIRADTLHIAK